VEIGLNPVRTQEGMFVMASIIDITQRRKAEHEAQRQRNELAHLSRVTTISGLSSSLAHELNQPLSAVQRNAESAEMVLQMESPDLVELRTIIAEILADQRRAGDVIDHLRALLKNRPLETQATSVRQIIDEVIGFVRADAISRELSLEIRIPQDLPMVKGDRVHLQQVLLNLVMNAMDALNGNKREERKITISASRILERMVEVAVSDTGSGIPPEVLEHMFAPFFTTKASGMGIGLAVSRNIIEAHRGRIEARNNADRGATVYFTLPVAMEGKEA
jgi:two-component system, LuxR family, sensor kinase FixL